MPLSKLANRTIAWLVSEELHKCRRDKWVPGECREKSGVLYCYRRDVVATVSLVDRGDFVDDGRLTTGGYIPPAVRGGG